LGGETVYDQSFADGSLASKSVAVRWDTTHFPHGAAKDIKVKAKMKVWRGIKVFPSESWIYWEGPYEVSAPDAAVSVSIYNYGWAGDIAEFANNWNCRQYALDAYEGMNHEADESIVTQPPLVPFAGVTEELARHGIRLSTVFYIDCHGSVDYFGHTTGYWGDPNYPYPNMPPWQLGPSDVLAERQWAEANGYPPLNFAFLDSCKNGQLGSLGVNDNYMAFLNLSAIAYSPTYIPVNRAFLGWLISVSANWSVTFDRAFWQEIVNGATVYKARNVAYYNLWQEYSDDPSFPYGLNDRTLVTGLYGDAYCRLHGLYTGTDGYNATWYEVSQ